MHELLKIFLKGDFIIFKYLYFEEIAGTKESLIDCLKQEKMKIHPIHMQVQIPYI